MTKLVVETINHVGLVVSDAEAAERFYVGVLGLRRHHARPSWLLLNDESALHLIHLPDAAADASPNLALRHVALQVPDLRALLGLLIDRGVGVFQVDFDGSVRHLASPDDPLDFGSPRPRFPANLARPDPADRTRR